MRAVIVRTFRDLKIHYEGIEGQPGYIHEEREKILSSFKNDSFTVIYGNSEMARIIGIGKNIDLAFTDFVNRWGNSTGLNGLKRISECIGIICNR